MTYFKGMNAKRSALAVFAGLWVVFIIFDNIARWFSAVSPLRRNPIGSLAVKGMFGVKSLSLFLLIVGNIILIMRLFTAAPDRTKTPQRG